MSLCELAFGQFQYRTVVCHYDITVVGIDPYKLSIHDLLN